MCVTDRHVMTLAVKVALNPNTTNQKIFSVRLNHCLKEKMTGERQSERERELAEIFF